MRHTALSLIIGALMGAFFTHQHYVKKELNAQIKQQQAWEANNESIKAASDYWQTQLDNANNREPITVERRVYVNAPVRSTCGDQVHDGRSAVRYELDRATIQHLESVAASAEQQYRECSHRLKAWQDKFKDVK